MLFRHVSGQFADVLMTFLQIKYSDFTHYLLLLIALVVGYRIAGLIVLNIRIRFTKPE